MSQECQQPTSRRLGAFGSGPILLQKSKVATVGISGENLKREEIDDSYSVSPATELAYEFSVRRRGPSHLYRKTEPAALGNFDTFCKTTFATVSAKERHFEATHRLL
jgi:hypothetical protein